jgi:pyrroline-5-carboxylate reductase
MLGGWKKAGKMPQEIVVSDTNVEGLNNLKAVFPEIRITPHDNTQPASADLVFLAVHPPMVKDVLSGIASHLKSKATLVSLVPKCSIESLSGMSGGFQRIVRMIPNAPSLVNSGYNPLIFSSGITHKERAELLDIFRILGECPEVEENTLEAYAILTAMGPTYLWFQLYELQELGKSFGLREQSVEDGIMKMVQGTLKTMHESGLSSEAVMDLIPVKPLGEHEENIRKLYTSKLGTLFQKLHG